jgi:hypothetical protein
MNFWQIAWLMGMVILAGFIIALIRYKIKNPDERI